MSSAIYRDEEMPPPSYDSIFGKIKNAKQESDGNITFLHSVIGIITNTVGYIIGLVIILGIPIACLFVGGFYLHNCPAQRYIPIFLIVFGAFTIVRDLSSIFQSMKARKDGNTENQQNKRPNPFDSILSCFLFAWFICGNVWIYGTHNKFTTSDVNATDYCHPTVFYFSFWLINATYILMGCMCLCGCACCLYVFCLHSAAERSTSI